MILYGKRCLNDLCTSFYHTWCCKPSPWWISGSASTLCDFVGWALALMICKSATDYFTWWCNLQDNDFITTSINDFVSVNIANFVWASVVFLLPWCCYSVWLFLYWPFNFFFFLQKLFFYPMQKL